MNALFSVAKQEKEEELVQSAGCTTKSQSHPASKPYWSNHTRVHAMEGQKPHTRRLDRISATDKLQRLASQPIGCSQSLHSPLKELQYIYMHESPQASCKMLPLSLIISDTSIINSSLHSWISSRPQPYASSFRTPTSCRSVQPKPQLDGHLWRESKNKMLQGAKNREGRLQI